MTEHKLKTWPDAFEAIWHRQKRYELRKNDRDFSVGDILVLQEWDPETGLYSGRVIRASVTYISRADGAFPGLVEGFCVLSLAILVQTCVSCV